MSEYSGAGKRARGVPVAAPDMDGGGADMVEEIVPTPEQLASMPEYQIHAVISVDESDSIQVTVTMTSGDHVAIAKAERFYLDADVVNEARVEAITKAAKALAWLIGGKAAPADDNGA